MVVIFLPLLTGILYF